MAFTTSAEGGEELPLNHRNRAAIGAGSGFTRMRCQICDFAALVFGQKPFFGRSRNGGKRLITRLFLRPPARIFSILSQFSAARSSAGLRMMRRAVTPTSLSNTPVPG